MWKWIVALGALLWLQTPATAQAASAEQAVADPFERVMDAIEGSVSDEELVQSSVRALEAAWRQNSMMAALERNRPGSLAIISEAARPTLASWRKRVKAEFRPRFIAALRNHLTAEDALEVADFYETPVSRRALAAIPNNDHGTAMATARGNGTAVTSTQVRQDATVAREAALASLSEADRAELAREAASRPALLKLVPAQAEFSELRALMEKAPMTAAENATLQAAIAAAFERTR
jgi:hypothetical protein